MTRTAFLGANEVQTERRRLVQPLLSALDEHLTARVAGGLLLAVSGGPDSRALLEACALWPGRFLGDVHVVSVDHGTRASSSDEAAAVVGRARALGFDATAARLPRGVGGRVDEATLRQARYQALLAPARGLQLSCIVVAHHQSDVAEGALLSWLGGGGGGASMARVRAADATVEVVRPFLSLTRATLRLALSGVGAHDVVIDPERSSQRSRVRRFELNALGGSRPRVEAQLARAAARLRDDEEVLRASAMALLEVQAGAVRVGPGPPALLRRGLREALAQAIPGADARDSSPAIDGIVELMRRGQTAEVHLKGAVAQVQPEGVLVRLRAATARPVAAQPAATHDGYKRLSADRLLLMLANDAEETSDDLTSDPEAT